MTSERIERRIAALLDAADEAVARREWQAVAENARAVLAIEQANADALSFEAMALANLDGAVEAIPPPGTGTLSPEPPSFAGGRYEVRRFLGEGGKKRVFLAHDTQLDRDVAFALIKTEGLDEVGRARVLREAQAMGRLTHPQLVTIFDIGEHAGQPYLVQELMSGGDVEGLLEGHEGGLPLPRALEIGIAVCRGLEYAHGQGVVHRDLKPGNVWLTADGAAKVGDLGLALQLGRSRLTSHGMMVGTFGYMPPEQALGAEVTPQADLYALGAMLYELITGRPPFQGETPTAVISQHLNAPPVAPSWYSDHCPPELEALILRLLEKRPEDRPTSAAEVRAVLERVDPEGRSPSHSDQEANPLDRLARGVFVGRERELEQLREALDAALRGRGSVVMLVGEPGIGKTRTVQELETYARLRGAEVYWGRTHESAGMPAYWPWVQVGRAWGATNDVATVAARGGLQSPELVRFFPELRQFVPGLPPAELRASDDAAQFLLFDAYTQFIRAQAADKPWMVVLDDLHWADKPTLQLLGYVARELANMRVLIVGTYRDTDLVRTHPLSEALAELNRGGGFQRVVLRGLGREEVGEYIRQRSNLQPARAVVDRIYEETEGSPFFLSEVVNLLVEEGTLERDSVSEIALPDGVREALGRRLDRLSAEANELLQVAAIVGREFAYETLTLLGDRDADELLRLIEEALDARVIEETGQAGRYRFTHALMQETLLEELSTTRRVRLHGQVGEALERRWGDRAGDYATRLAVHFSESATLTPEHASRAVHYLVLAGEQAERTFAWPEATRLYEQAVSLIDSSPGVDPPVDPAVVLAALARSAPFAAEFRTAWRASMRALDMFRARKDWVAFAGAVALLDQNWGPPERILALIREALEGLRDDKPDVEAVLLGKLFVLAPPHEHERAASRLRAILASRDIPSAAASLRSYEVRLRSRAGEFHEAYRLAIDELSRRRWLGTSLPIQATGNAMAAGDLDGAMQVAIEWLEQARREQRRLVVENVSAVIAGLHLLRAEFAEYAALEAEGAKDLTYMWNRQRMYAAVLAGDREGALRLLPDPKQVRGSVNLRVLLVADRAATLWRAGEVDQARAEWREVEALLEDGDHASSSNGFFYLSDALGYLDEAGPSVAGTLLATWVRTAVLAPNAPRSELKVSWAVPTCTARAIAGWACSFGDLDDAERRYHDALEWCERERCPIEAGRCWQGLAEVAERRGDHPRALACLDRAGELFARHDAKFFLDQVIAKKDILKA